MRPVGLLPGGAVRRTYNGSIPVRQPPAEVNDVQTASCSPASRDHPKSPAFSTQPHVAPAPGFRLTP
jgi:hypothetical protein